MDLITVTTTPFDDQRPGTAGLRRRVEVFRQPHYLENFVQATLDACFSKGCTLVIGGDGRYFNDRAIQSIIRLGAAHGVARMIIGRHGWLSTPAAANLIAERNADGGLILTASHNPGGPDGDFGIKINVHGGGQASAALADQIWAHTKTLQAYRQLGAEEVDLDRLAEHDYHGMQIEVVDPLDDYCTLLEGLFDLDRLRELIGSGFRMRFDAMHAITGPYAKRLLEDTLGAPAGSVVNATPKEDFGGGHADPNPVDAAALVDFMYGDQAVDFAAASDGDGDRNMILGPGLVVSPGDSLALLAAHATCAPGYRDGLRGIARSMPTARAADRVAEALNVPCYETPTGWRFFASLLQNERISLCGEESFGTGSSHVREKDGLWAVLFWLNIIAVTGRSVDQLVHEHWARFGRDFFARHDYHIAERDRATDVMSSLEQRLGTLPGQRAGELTVADALRFDYTDPVSGEVAANQGLIVHFTDGARAVFRLSGTGTGGATLRLYADRHVTDPADVDRDRHAMLAQTMAAAAALAEIPRITGLAEPSAVI
ncbi:MAG: alpha-D-glucose phosphate-specific phosphoglucomutase [Pseudomonadota bacterium]